MTPLPEAIEDYALIGDCHTGALVGRRGSIDWLCMPRFDSASMFASLLGNDDHGHWHIAPVGADACTSRHYERDTFVLVTRWVTEAGEVEVTDFMPRGNRRADLVRRVRSISGVVEMAQVLRIRFDYAAALPWMRQTGTEDEPELLAVAGPDAVVIRGMRFAPVDHAHCARFTIAADQVVDTVMTWFPAHEQAPSSTNSDEQLERTRSWWRDWFSQLGLPLCVASGCRTRARSTHVARLSRRGIPMAGVAAAGSGWRPRRCANHGRALG